MRRRHSSFHSHSDSWFWLQAHRLCLYSFALLKSIVCRILLLFLPMLLLLLLYLIYDDVTRAGPSESEEGRVCLVEEISFGKTFSDRNSWFIQLLGLGWLLLLLLWLTSDLIFLIFLCVDCIVCILISWLHDYFIFDLNLSIAQITPLCLLLRWVSPDRLNCTRDSGFNQSLLSSIPIAEPRLEFSCSFLELGILVTLCLILAPVIVVLRGRQVGETLTESVLSVVDIRRKQ